MQFVLSHRHPPEQCGVAFAAWRGFESPLRRTSVLGSCASESGERDHLLIWMVDARSADAALELLPDWVAQRTEARTVGEVAIP